jgi:hypothetical protein
MYDPTLLKLFNFFVYLAYGEKYVVTSIYKKKFTKFNIIVIIFYQA